MTDLHRVLITGVGQVTPWTTESDEVQAPEITGFEIPEGRPAFGFELPDFELEAYVPGIQTFVDRTSALGLAAGQLALADAGLLDLKARPEDLDIGCAYGSMMGCLEAMELFWKKVKQGKPKFAPPLPFTHSFANSPSSLLCIAFGLKGSAATFSGEALAGMEALLFGFDQIRTGSAKAVMVCASESLTRPLHAHLFAEGRLNETGNLGLGEGKAKDAETSRGVVPGEGGACVMLEEADCAAARGRKGYAELTQVHLNAEAPEAGPADAEGATVLVASPPPADSMDLVSEQARVNQRFKNVSKAYVLWAPKGELFAVSPILATVFAAQYAQIGKWPDGLKELPAARMNGSRELNRMGNAVVWSEHAGQEGHAKVQF